MPKFYDWPINENLHAHMAMRQNQNKQKGLTKAETWFYEEVLVFTKYKWHTQTQWGFRLFDFWCHFLGCAVEIDGAEHNFKKDHERDFKEWNRSRIIVLRVRNYDRVDAEMFLEAVFKMPSWNDRRKQAGMNPILT